MLETIARQNGFTAFAATVLRENASMLKVFKKRYTNCKLTFNSGSEVLVHWTTPVGTLLSRIPGQVAPGVGESRTLHFAPEKLHLFDSKTEQALGN